MQINLLKSVVGDIAGRQATEIVDLLVGKKDVNEFIIAKKLKLTINQTRNILYKLADSGLVSFTRKKDKRKGWYIYFWTLDSLKSLELLENKLSAEINNLRNQLKSRRTKRFYMCKTCNVEVSEETALLNEFTCQECGEVYHLAHNEEVIKELDSKISRAERHLAVIREEKEKAREKQGKKKVKTKAKKRKKKKTRKVKKKKIKKRGKKKEEKIKRKVKKKAKKKVKRFKRKTKKKRKKKKR